MKRTVQISPAAILAATLTGALLTLPLVSFAAPPAKGVGAAMQDSTNDAVASRLNKSQFKDVKASVESGIATLTGTVSLYEYKADAEKRVRKAKGVNAVRNEIEVSGPTVSDEELKTRLAEKLSYDRVGYGNTFNAISVNVENGVVALGGRARRDGGKDSAMGL